MQAVAQAVDNIARAAKPLSIRGQESARKSSRRGATAVPSEDSTYALQEIFELPRDAAAREVARSSQFVRRQVELFGRAKLLVDEFSDVPGASCCFVRLAPGPARFARLVAGGDHTVESCPSGGWLVKSSGEAPVAYWIPRSPVLRRVDSRGRILSEQPASLAGIAASSRGIAVDVEVRDDQHLDCAIWRFAGPTADVVAGLGAPLVLEMQPVFMWGSHTVVRGPADVYRYLIDGSVYENRFEPRQKWKICAENEAYALYATLQGLELSTRKRLYGLLKRQLLCSVMARQSQDGGWHHGEWSDAMESHYRLHNGAVLLLEAALEECPDDATRNALDKAAAFTARHTDRTDLGPWFLHDSLEEDLELRRESRSPLIPSRILGKAPGNGLVLNTHLDSMIVLDRYREVTGNGQYAQLVDSARKTSRALLALRPAESLYRLLYSAVGLTLLPSTEARRLPLAIRAVKRAAREYLLPRLHKIKERFPRIVMPGGLIERHISMPNLDLNYHTVNLMDLARLWRRFPDEPLANVIEDAVNAVTGSSLLAYWMELKQRQALGYWLEALYHLCTLRPAIEYRRYLAEAVLIAEDAALGLPPSLLGGNPEIVRLDQRIPCPSPSDGRLRVVNLSCGKREILVVNSSSTAIELSWESALGEGLLWRAADGRTLRAPPSSPSVPARGWLLGEDEGHFPA